MIFIWLSKYYTFVLFFCFGYAGCMKLKDCVWKGMWLEKHWLFCVAFALCFSFSLLGGWLNESFGQRLRYLSGLALQEKGGRRERENLLVLVAS